MNTSPAVVDDELDPRAAAFCSQRLSELFHGIAYSNMIWKVDPLDIPSIHAQAREAFERIIDRVMGESGLATPRMLLLLGEAGSGKTHLMRVFRNLVQGSGRGYCGFMQMTAATEEYDRYILNNLIDSLDQPYDAAQSETTGLKRLSTAMAELVPGASEALARLREANLEQAEIDDLVNTIADAITLDPRFESIDHHLVQVLLHFQSNTPAIKTRVLKYLRCEELTPRDIERLGGVPWRSYSGAAARMIRLLGQLMWVAQRAPMVLFVDQLEDRFDVAEAPVQFRRLIAMLCDIVSHVPSAVVVISCLSDLFDQFRSSLTRPQAGRLTARPGPMNLSAACDQSQVEDLVRRRLSYLFESAGIEPSTDDPTYPIPRAFLAKLAGLGVRDVLDQVDRFRQRCLDEGRIVADPAPGPGGDPPSPGVTDLEQAWNNARTGRSAEPPDDEYDRARLLAKALGWCTDELAPAERIAARSRVNQVEIDRQASNQSVTRMLAGICDRPAQGGGLSKQIQELKRACGSRTIVIVRTTEFPASPKAMVTKEIGEIIKAGGRTVVIENSDWRAMTAMDAFRAERAQDAAFPAWLKQYRPISQLRSVRRILDLDSDPGKDAGAASSSPPTLEKPKPPAPPGPAPSPPPSIVPPKPEPPRPEPPSPSTSLHLGQVNDRRGDPLEIDPGSLARHAAFLGSSGSGKTTAALAVIEQLLLQGVPAILIDRKGDLCSYARPGLGLRDDLDDDARARGRRLRSRVEVALYTPRRPDGRPLSIAAVPAGLGSLPAHEREQAAKFAASAIAGMMNYSDRTRDQSRLAILVRAIDLLSQEKPDLPVPIGSLVDFIAEPDRALLNAVGRLDSKLFDPLVQDLETLRHHRGDLLSAQGESLDIETLLGLDDPGLETTKLSIVSTRFLGTNQDIQFWVAQLLMAMGRFIARAPSDRLRAVILFDEADLYLPATSKPATKEPMENLLRRARSAGLGVMLATQSPGDLDYKCRDNIHSWFVGQVREKNSIDKMKPMLAECRFDAAAKLASQKAGEFLLIRDGQATPFKSTRCLVNPVQVAEDDIAALARGTTMAS